MKFTKKQVIAMVAISSFVLGQVSVFAEETASSSILTEIVTSSENETAVSSSGTEYQIGSENLNQSRPAETVPSTGNVTIGNQSGTTESTEIPHSSSTNAGNSTTVGDSASTVPVVSEANQGGIVTESKEAETTEKPSEKLPDKPAEETPKEEKPTVAPTVEEKQAEENTGVRANETPKPITTTEEEILAQPIVTNTGHAVVGTKEGQVYVQTVEGQVELKNASEIGAVKQKDGTVALKDEKGELKILPSTGEEQSIMTLLGLMMLAGLALFKKTPFKR